MVGDLALSVGSIAGMAFTLTEAMKMSGLPSKYSPLISILVGVGIALLMGINPFFGLMAGTSASGLYSGFKKNEIKSEETKPADNIPHID